MDREPQPAILLYDETNHYQLISVPLQCKFDETKKTSPHLAKKKQEFIEFVKVNFGEQYVNLVPSQDKQYWSANVPAVILRRWLLQQLSQLHDDPKVYYQSAYTAFKQIKPTLQRIGFRMELTLLGFLLRVYVEFRSQRVDDLYALLFEWDEETNEIVKTYRLDCSTRKDPTNAWSDSRSQAWKIVKAFIEKLVDADPSLVHGALLNLALNTKVQSLYAKGNVKPYEVLCSKARNSCEFVELEKSWNTPGCPPFQEKSYSWEEGKCVQPRRKRTRKAFEQETVSVAAVPPVPIVHAQPATMAVDSDEDVDMESPSFQDQQPQPISFKLPAPLQIFKQLCVDRPSGFSLSDSEIPFVCEPRVKENIWNLLSDEAVEQQFGSSSYEAICWAIQNSDADVMTAYQKFQRNLVRIQEFTFYNFETFCRIVNYVLSCPPVSPPTAPPTEKFFESKPPTPPAPEFVSQFPQFAEQANGGYFAPPQVYQYEGPERYLTPIDTTEDDWSERLPPIQDSPARPAVRASTMPSCGGYDSLSLGFGEKMSPAPKPRLDFNINPIPAMPNPTDPAPSFSVTTIPAVISPPRADFSTIPIRSTPSVFVDAAQFSIPGHDPAQYQQYDQQMYSVQGMNYQQFYSQPAFSQDTHAMNHGQFTGYQTVAQVPEPQGHPPQRFVVPQVIQPNMPPCPPLWTGAEGLSFDQHSMRTNNMQIANEMYMPQPGVRGSTWQSGN